VLFEGEFDTVKNVGIDFLPIQKRALLLLVRAERVGWVSDPLSRVASERMPAPAGLVRQPESVAIDRSRSINPERYSSTPGGGASWPSPPRQECFLAEAARKPTRREDLGIESRCRIVCAATAFMAEHGFAGTSISAVKKKSSPPPGSIHWHFENKEALLVAVIEEAATLWFGALHTAGDASP